MLQVSSTSNSFYSHNNIKIQQGNAEYLHQAVKFSDAYEIIEFSDADTGRTVQFYADHDVSRALNTKFRINTSNSNIIKATGSLENYLQKMWSSYRDDYNVKDINSDGYLNIKEVANSRRVVDIDYNSQTKEFTLNELSFNDISSSEEQALESVKEYFKENGFLSNRISVDQDFNNFLYTDRNLDANIEDIEILADAPPEKLREYEGLTIPQKADFYTMIKAWKKKKEEEEGNLNLSEKNSVSLNTSFDYIDKLLNSDNINEEPNKIKELNKVRENLKSLSNYINTQADNAKIFSLKV